MREIKFRAWDKKREKMFPVKYIRWEGERLVQINLKGTRKKPEIYTALKTNLILMQYTGLKDKKRTKEYPEGQEIYDGDIISIKRGWKYLWIVRWHNFKWGAHNIQSPNTFQNFKQVSKWRSVEVVGNLYENPELKGDL